MGGGKASLQSNINNNNNNNNNNNKFRRHPRGLGQKYKKRQGSETKRQNKTLVLFVIALAVAFASIAYSISFGLFHSEYHHSDASSPSFEPPSTLESKKITELLVSAPNEENPPTKQPPLSKTNATANSATATASNSGNTHPETKASSRLFFKYDAAGPKPIPGSARSHALPNAVPPTNTIPLEHVENKSYHISQRTNTSLPLSMTSDHPPRYNWNHTYHDDFRTLYLYNPSVLPLHNTLVVAHNNDNDNSSKENTTATNTTNYYYYEDPDALSEPDLLALTGGDPSVRYVATFRAYLGCNCFGPNMTNRTLMTAGEQISYLAIALLDERLDVVDGTDVLIDLNAGPNRGLYGRQFLEDCRIFLMKGGIYLLCNEELKRIQITRTTTQRHRKTSLSTPPLSSQSQSQAVPPPGYGTKQGIPLPYVYPNVRGDGLNITLLSHRTKISGGKNFNIFRTTRQNLQSKHNNNTTSEDDNHNDSSAAPIHQHYVQLFPQPHKYIKLHVPDGRDSKGDEFGNVLKDPVSNKKSNEEIAPQLGGLPEIVFDTPDTLHKISKCREPKQMNCTTPLEVPFFDDERDHGTACCVRVLLPRGNDNNDDDSNATRNGREVMVGITHQKLSRRTNFWLLDIHKRYKDFGIDRFVSRFVAYDAKHPFDVVARSGWFCLGFATDPTELSHPQRSTLAGQNKQFRLDLFDNIYECPMIHFASGFSEVVGNSSRAIIGYGVNDCHPRMFVVEKDEIVRLLTTG